MNPATIALIIGLVEELIKDAPAIAEQIRGIFAKTQPTPADWLALRAHVLGASFESLAPDARTSEQEPQAPV